MKYLFFIFCLILCSCEYSEPVGLCHNPPKTFKNSLSFNAQGGVDSVFVSDSFWWLTGYDLSENGCEMIYSFDSNYCSNNYCHNNDEIMKFQCSWLEVTRTKSQLIFVTVNSNETNQERSFEVGIQAGNCHSGFTITQSAE
ncbi:MAG: hypothetical protein LBR60_00100 [Fibrobacter sp.]|jgi:hypothetical protein|nr:hypothetical protein [Fibrobacter sp.]